jgi:hypothetical protein
VNAAGFAAAIATSLTGDHLTKGVDEWTQGYKAAVRDIRKLVFSRGLLTPQLTALFGDLDQDAHVIEHELNNRAQRKNFAAAREALNPDLFGPPKVLIKRPT